MCRLERGDYLGDLCLCILIHWPRAWQQPDYDGLRGMEVCEGGLPGKLVAFAAKVQTFAREVQISARDRINDLTRINDSSRGHSLAYLPTCGEREFY